MDDIFVKTCVICNPEKGVEIFYRKNSENKCNIKGFLNETLIIKLTICKIAEINLYGLKT